MITLCLFFHSQLLFMISIQKMANDVLKTILYFWFDSVNLNIDLLSFKHTFTHFNRLYLKILLIYLNIKWYIMCGCKYKALFRFQSCFNQIFFRNINMYQLYHIKVDIMLFKKSVKCESDLLKKGSVWFSIHFKRLPVIIF